MLKKKNFKKSFKLLSVLLSVVLLLFSIPTSALAADENNISESLMESVVPNVPSDDYVYDSREFFSDETVGVTEAIERREENVKHFILPDGTYQAVTYVNAVHRMDSDGVWQDINNNLYLQGAGGSAAYVTSDSRVHFSKNAPVITVSENGYTVKMTYMTAPVPGNENISAEETVFSGMTSSVTNAEARAEKYDTLDVAMIIDNKSRMAYNSVKSGMNIEYELNGNNVKENIIVNSSSDIYEYIFRLDLTGLTAELADGGYILIKDETSGKVEYRIPAPYMYDAEGKISYDVAYELVAVKNGVYLLRITADETWINSEDRAFPVTIDPTIIADNVFLDTYVDSSDPSATHGYDDNMLLNSSTTAMVRIDLPAIPTNSVINAVQLNMYAYDNREEGDIVLGVYPILDSWIETNACYNNIPPIGTEAITTETVYLNMESSLYSPVGINFTVTDYIASFYEVTGGVCSGMAIRRLSGVSSGNLVSSNFDYGMYGAFLTINYSFDVVSGVYAIKSVNSNWMTVEMAEGATVPSIGANIRQKDMLNPNTSFNRASLFKISKISGTDRYIIRSMLDNTMSFGISGDKIVTKKIANFDGNVSIGDTFHIESGTGGFTIRPYGSTYVVSLYSETAAYLTAIDNSSTYSGKYWTFEKYTGNRREGYEITEYPDLIAGYDYTFVLTSWSTRLQFDTAKLEVKSEYSDIASLTWDWDAQNGTLLIHDEGPFVLNVKIGYYDFSVYNLYQHSNSAVLPIEEGTYFVKNKRFDTYIGVEVDDTNNPERSALKLMSYSNDNNKKWIFIHVTNGFYKIISPYSGYVITVQSMYQNVSGKSLIQDEDANAPAQLWKSDLSSSGNIILRPLYARASNTDWSMTAGADNSKVEQNAYVNDTNYGDEWVLQCNKTIDSYNMSFFGIEDGAHDHSSGVINCQRLMYQNGYNNVNVQIGGFSPDTVLMSLKNSSVFISRGHGGAILGTDNETVISTGITVSHGSSGEIRLYSHDNPQVTTNDLCIGPNDSFANADIIFFVGCKTGRGGANGSNIAARVVDQGATVAVGFTETINCGPANEWIKQVCELLCQGETVEDAVSEASIDYSETTGLKSAVVYGNKHYRLGE